MSANIVGKALFKKDLCKLDLKDFLVLNRGEGMDRVLALVSVHQRPLTECDFVWVTLVRFYSETGDKGRVSIKEGKPFLVTYLELYRPAPTLRLA